MNRWRVVTSRGCAIALMGAAEYLGKQVSGGGWGPGEGQLKMAVCKG